MLAERMVEKARAFAYAAVDLRYRLMRGVGKMMRRVPRWELGEWARGFAEGFPEGSPVAALRASRAKLKAL